MKIGIYNPYFDSLSGGERYTLTLASHWSKTHDVSIFWDTLDVLYKAQRQLDIDLSGVNITQNIFRERNVFKKLQLTRRYDLIFVLSDGSIPSTLAKHNILHFQVPFPTVKHSALKLLRYHAVVCNSEFTKHLLDARVSSHALVIYPPVRPVLTDDGKKENIIVSVGRFTGFHTAKKQHVLIEAFAQGLKDKKLNGWKLILAGVLLPSDQDYFDKLKEMAKGLPITFEANNSHNSLIDYYQKSKIYWHAAGYGETDPRWMEHFGITTVEAMSAGAVPVVFAGGGQQEIVEEGASGYLWHTIDELIERTTEMMRDTRKREAMRMQAQKRALTFHESKFTQSFDDLLMNITGKHSALVQFV